MSTINDAKVVLITGSQQGLGAETARLFAKNGYKVMIHGIDQNRVDAMVAECEQLSPNKYKMYGSVLNFEDPENGGLLVDQTVAAFNRLDILICNACFWGVTDPDDIPECWDIITRMVNVNIMAHIKACLHATAHLKKVSIGANIVFIGAAAYLKPIKGMFFYAVYGSTMISLGRAMAAQLAPEIRVNCVTVGPAKSPIWEDYGYDSTKYSHITLLQRLGEPQEIANTIYFIATDTGSFITGSNLLVDGGYLANAKFEPAPN